MNEDLSLLTVEEIGQLLKVSRNTVYYWVGRSEIPFLRVGKHLRFDKNDVLAHFRTLMDRCGKDGSCLATGPLLSSRPKSWSLKTGASLADSTTKGIGNGDY